MTPSKIGTKVTCVLRATSRATQSVSSIWGDESFLPLKDLSCCAEIYPLPTPFRCLFDMTFTTFYSFSMCMDVCTSAYLWRLENLQNQFLPYTMWVLGIKLISGLMAKQLYLLSHSFLTMAMIFNIETPPCVSSCPRSHTCHFTLYRKENGL